MGIFKNVNFLRLFIGRLVTNAGDSLYYVAAMWLVYDLGGSSFYTGLAGFLILIPNLLQFLIGPLVDRWPLKRTLLVPEISQGILVLLVPIGAYMGWLSVTSILIIMPSISLLNQFVYPAQQVTLPQLINKDQLVKGNSALSFAYQGADLIFNALAGVLVALVGALTLFYIDSITFAIAAILFATIKIPKKIDDTQNPDAVFAVKSYFSDLKEGINFIKGSIIAKLFLASIVANFSIGATMAVLPEYSDWRGGAETYGLLLAAISGGVLIGSLLPSFLERVPIGKLTIIAFFIGTIFWVVSVFLPWNMLSIILFGIAWIAVGITNVINAAALQRIVPQKLLARIFSVAASVGTSAMPIGSLLGGYIASITNSIVVMGIAAFGFLFISLYTFIMPILRKLPASTDLSPEQFGFKIDGADDKKVSESIPVT